MIGSGLVREEFAGTLNENDTVSETVDCQRSDIGRLVGITFIEESYDIHACRCQQNLVLTQACGPD